MTPSDLDPRNDDALLRGWLAGDAAAGKALVLRHYENVARFFSFKAGHEHALELTQDTFVAVQRGLARFRGESTVKAWIYGIARNKLLRHFEKLAHQRDKFDPEKSSILDLDPTPSSLLAAHQQRSDQQRLLLAALCRLPLDVQIMLELHYWDQLSIDEIAQIVAKRPGNVRVMMHRGRRRLEQWMAELAESPEQLDLTLSGLSAWAERVRKECGATTTNDDAAQARSEGALPRRAADLRALRDSGGH